MEGQVENDVKKTNKQINTEKNAQAQTESLKKLRNWSKYWKRKKLI